MLTAQIASVTLINVLSLAALDAQPPQNVDVFRDRISQASTDIARTAHAVEHRYRIAKALCRDAESAAAVLSDPRLRSSSSAVTRRSLRIYIRRMEFMTAMLRNHARRQGDADATEAAHRTAYQLAIMRACANELHRYALPDEAGPDADRFASRP